MFQSRKFWFGFFLAFLALAGFAQTARADGLTIPACAFHPIDSVSDNDRTWYANESALYVNHSIDGPYFVAPVSLPEGVTVKKVRVYLTDNGSGPDDEVRVTLNRTGLYSGTKTQMAYVCNHLTPALPHKTTRQTKYTASITSPAIYNASYTYTVYVHFIFDCTDRVKLHAVRIEYE